MTIKLLIAVGFALGLPSAAFAEMSEAGDEAMVEAGRIMFQYRCRSCHAETTNNPSYGPFLKGVFGRKAGSVVGFNYSDALRNSKIVWNEETLRSWIADNKAMMPGTKMRHVGVSDKAEQNFLIHYLKHISK